MPRLVTLSGVSGVTEMTGGNDRTGEAVCRVREIFIGDGDLDLDFRVFFSLISLDVSSSFLSRNVENSQNSGGFQSKVGSTGSLLASNTRSEDNLSSVLSSRVVVTKGGRETWDSFMLNSLAVPVLNETGLSVSKIRKDLS